MFALDVQKTERLALAKGWGLAELQRRAGISNSQVYKIKNGACRPRAATIAKLAQALDVKPTELVK